METVTQEQDVKRPSLFLKPTNGSVLTLKSHLVKIKSHYLEAEKKSVLCSSENCLLCARGDKVNQEFYYWGIRGDGEHVIAGPIQVPGSVFFSMNEAEKLLKKDKRQIMWVISKQGEGKNTKYTTIRGDDVAPEAEEVVQEQTAKLERVLQKYEDTLQQRLNEYLATAPSMAAKKVAK